MIEKVKIYIFIMSLNQGIVAGVKKLFDSKEIIINIIPLY